MKVASVKFNNYGKSYAFYTKLDLVPGRMYKISTKSTSYSAPVAFEGWRASAPAGIEMKEIIEATEYEELEDE